LVGWAGTAFALWRIARGRLGWTRLAIPAAWIVVYFGWLGANWVATMRYFLPIYGTLAIFAAWLLVELIRWRPLRFVAGALTVFVVGYTALQGVAMTSIYRSVLTRTGVSLWFQQNVPGDI